MVVSVAIAPVLQSVNVSGLKSLIEEKYGFQSPHEAFMPL